jgi:SAM-dependent methyltransferase
VTRRVAEPVSAPTAPDAWEHADVEAATDAYAARFRGPIGAWFLDVQAAHTLSLLPDAPSPLSILEVGGGHAQLTPHLIAAGHNVTVLGSAPACAARLAQWTRDGRCSFDAGNPAALPYADSSFDVVLAFRMLAHVTDWRAFIGELCRVARQTAIVDYPSSRSTNAFYGPLSGFKTRIENDTRPFRLLAPAAVRKAFRDHSFEPGQFRAQYLMPMVLYRAIGSRRLAAAVEVPARLLGLTRLLGSPVILRADRHPGET